jgi:hypothetical protein
MDGFFGGPARPPVEQYGFAAPAPAPVFGGYVPPAAFGTPVGATTTATARVPEPVTVACTLLGVFAAIGAFTVIAVVLLSSGSSGSSGSGTSSASDIGLGALYGVLWGGSAFINTGLIVFLRQGNALARVITSVVCGLWSLYWLHVLYQLTNATAGSLFAGPLVHLGELLLIGLAVAAALPAVLLWRGTGHRHFA